LLKSNLEILKTVEDDKVKAVVAELESGLTAYTEVVVEKEPVKEETVLEPVIKEPVVEETVIDEPIVEETVLEEPVKEEVIVEETVEEPVKEEPVVEETVVPELSLKIAGKLKEAAFALEQKELELRAKDEIIQGFKNKINALELLKNKTTSELSIYKKKEALELATQKAALTNELLSLYLELGIQKTTAELAEFTTVQMLELQQALS